jgi:hypothetical protein
MTDKIWTITYQSGESVKTLKDFIDLEKNHTLSCGAGRVTWQPAQYTKTTYLVTREDGSQHSFDLGDDGGTITTFGKHVDVTFNIGTASPPCDGYGWVTLDPHGIITLTQATTKAS